MANAERVQVDSVCNGLCGKYAQPSGRKVVVAVAARAERKGEEVDIFLEIIEEDFYGIPTELFVMGRQQKQKFQKVQVVEEGTNSFKIGMALFTPGDVVWAKMRGHPPWPAEILHTSAQLTGVPSGRYSIKFYGTYETAIMKSADLFDFVKHRAQFEVRRENKVKAFVQGFMLAVQEARQAVGLTNELKREEASLVRANAIPSTSEVDSGRRSMSRSRRPSSRFNSDDYVLQPLRGRGNSQSNNTPESPTKNKSKGNKNEKKSPVVSERRRKNSGSPIGGHRKRTISAYFDLDVSDNDPMLPPMLGDDFSNSLLDGFHSDANTDGSGVNGVKQRRTSKPKFVEDFITPSRSRTPSRERNNSTSSSARTR
ncbi:unnamed protein product [Enterobius vermicularis]|uniref:PWWP domain-containing protein n=1 Tax=Enterobius vermicularis TaxID=51028 RepID=A0A0N4V3V8_ENTVE|nr:unnamed protein product [Enterobius vermicularis]